MADMRSMMSALDDLMSNTEKTENFFLINSEHDCDGQETFSTSRNTEATLPKTTVDHHVESISPLKSLCNAKFRQKSFSIPPKLNIRSEYEYTGSGENKNKK